MEPVHATILVVHAHRATRTFLADNLTADGYEILEADAAADACRLLETKFPDLAIVDLGLPDRAGLELISAVRAADRSATHTDPDLPLIALAGGGELELLRAFAHGADDVVARPIDYQLLRARIVAVLRRCQRRPPTRRLRVGPLEVDVLARQVWLDGETIPLSNKEFALLRALAAEPTRVFTRDELLRGVWGFKSACETRTLDSHAARLRRKLSRTGARFVVNVWGVGYRLVDGAIGV